MNSEKVRMLMRIPERRLGGRQRFLAVVQPTLPVWDFTASGWSNLLASGYELSVLFFFMMLMMASVWADHWQQASEPSLMCN